MSSNFLLGHLNAEQQALAFGGMQACTARQGDTIIAKGQPGDWFYVVASGSYDVRIGDEAVLGYCREDEADAYPSFGELALLYSKPRAATVVCSAAGKLWRLHRAVFREVTVRSSAQQLTKTLRGVEVLKSLTLSQLQRLQDALSEVRRPNGARSRQISPCLPCIRPGAPPQGRQGHHAGRRGQGVLHHHARPGRRHGQGRSSAARAHEARAARLLR
mgnify:CR=1 FL=1